MAIVFAYQWMSEDMDLPNLSLPDGQDALIEQVAARKSAHDRRSGDGLGGDHAVDRQGEGRCGSVVRGEPRR